MDPFDALTNTSTMRAAWVALILCAACFAALFVYFLQNVEIRGENDDADGAPWRLIIGTLRDSFLVSVLYVMIDLLWRIQEFSGLLSASNNTNWITVYSIIVPFAHLLPVTFIVIVVVTRLMRLQKYLRR